MEETKKIEASLIFEVIGKPPEHLTEALNEIIKNIGEEKGIKIKNQKVNEPVLMKDQKEFYTSFAEIEIEADEIFQIVILMFKYMPAHVEIISPEKISATNNEWGEIITEIARRLHGYDEVARIVQTEKKVLENKLREVMEMKKDKEEKDSKEENSEEKNGN